MEIAGLEIDLVRQRMRSLRLTVYAGGRIRVAVPLQTPVTVIAEFVRARRGWIEQQQQRFAAREPAPQRRYESGETVPYLGQYYELLIVPAAGRAGVALLPEARQIRLSVPEGSTVAQREAVLAAWYRQQMKQVLPALFARWEPVVGRAAAAWGIKQMRTRWGTCNIGARRVWLNLELIKRPLPCLEYVLVHELTHLHERLHNARFWGLMDQFMPDWRMHRAELNRVLLAPGAAPDAD
ncbi:M48 family metallopeptidase [Hymenobacter sp. ISL-91]|uniref:M48 family metallopeptidase n=1 Tax=Hymenobacter sp. ISL-91 TaxID=2819151 RepID=UPI001BE691A0|nr:SprT family zinc-dependent metalloprotease [Hymenobacter sp. ISL-91]MBT2559187.1 M48 family metallopeptidase [Hymenobacter sp. ISL-91]